MGIEKTLQLELMLMNTLYEKSIFVCHIVNNLDSEPTWPQSEWYCITDSSIHFHWDPKCPDVSLG